MHAPGMTTEQILQRAMLREMDANRMYLKAAKMSKDPGAKSLYEELAREEFKHKELIEKLDRNKIKELKPEKVQSLGITEYLVAPLNFTDDMTPQDVLVFAMKKEDEAAHFYEELAASSQDDTVLHLAQYLATEEKKHKLRLETFYDEFILREN